MDTSRADPHARDVEALHEATALYTDAAVVAEVLDMAGWPRTGSLLDPSCGDGAFLVEALRRLGPHPDVPDERPSLRLVGVEIHPQAVEECRLALAVALESLGWDERAAAVEARAIARHGDFLLDDTSLPKGPVTVVGNPPYMRYARLPEGFKAAYASLPPEVRGDVQHAFLAKCADVAYARPGSNVTMVTSDRWLLNDGTAPLRRRIGERHAVERGRDLDPRTSFHRPKCRRKGSPPRVHAVVVAFRLLGEGAVGRPVARAGRTLSDVASVRLAPWLGPKGAFTFGADVARSLAPHVEAEGGGVLLVPAATGKDVVGDGLRPPVTWALVTRADHEPGAAIREHLEPRLANGPKRTRRGKWWMPAETVTLDISRPGLVVPRIAKGLRPVRLEAGRLPVDHALYVVVPDDGPIGLDEVAAILASDAAAAHASATAPRLEDGYLDIRAKLLRGVPLAA